MTKWPLKLDTEPYFSSFDHKYLIRQNIYCHLYLLMIRRKIKKVRNLIGGLMWIPNWNTNLPAGLFSVVSSLNEYICFIIVTHWLGKGGIMGSMSPHPWFLLLKIKMRCCKVMLRVWQYREHTLHGCLIYVIQQLWPKLNGHKSYSGHRLLLLISILSFLLSTRIWNIPNFTNAFHVSNFNISAIQYSTIPDILNTIVYKYRTFLFWNLSAYKAPTKP